MREIPVSQISLHGSRLLVRPLTLKDNEDFHSYRSDPEVTRYQGFDVWTEDECADFIQQQQQASFGATDRWVQLGIELTEEDKLIGDCAIVIRDKGRQAEMGITLNSQYQGSGFGFETVQLLLGYLFSNWSLHRIYTRVDAENTGAINLLLRLGFRKEGDYRKNIFFKGKWGSECSFAMLREEWEKLNP